MNSYSGRWYRLDRARIEPVPERNWIGAGGNSEASLRLIAEKADEWCTGGLPDAQLRETTRRLDDLARQAGRPPGAIERTLMNGVLIGRSRAELTRRARRLATLTPDLADQSPDAILARAENEFGWWVGPPERIAEQVEGARRAGLVSFRSSITPICPR